MLNKGTMDLDPLLAMRQYAQKKISVLDTSSGRNQIVLTNFIRAQPVSDIKPREVASNMFKPESTC